MILLGGSWWRAAHIFILFCLFPFLSILIVTLDTDAQLIQEGMTILLVEPLVMTPFSVKGKAKV